MSCPMKGMSRTHTAYAGRLSLPASPARPGLTTKALISCASAARRSDSVRRLTRVTLSGPAADGTVVNLTSSNPALVAVPASVAIAPGATSATFTARVQTNVPVNTPVTISGSFQGVAASDILNVLAASDKIG